MAGEFGIVLRKLRRDAKLTLRELSAITGLTIPRISRYELGKSIPKTDNLLKLSRVFEVDINLLTKMARREQKANKLGRALEPHKLLESLRKMDRGSYYLDTDFSLNDLKNKLSINNTNHPDVLRQIRKKCGLSLTALAKGMGVSLSLLSRIESGERRLSRRTLSYLNRLNTAANEICRDTQKELFVPAKSFEDIYIEFCTALPLRIPIYENLMNRIAIDHMFIHNKYKSIWGTNIVGIIVSNCLCYKNTIKKGDILIVSMDKKPNAGDLCIVIGAEREYIAPYNNIKDADYCVILQIIKTIKYK